MKKVLFILLLTISGGLYAADPGWSVSPAAFDYSMTVTAVLQTDCAELTNVSNRIGAFVGGQVRGTVLSSTVVNGRYIALLSVYSNTVSGESISFKIYNADTDQIIDADNILTFQDDASFGTPTFPILITDNNKPKNLALSNATIDENKAIGFVIGNFSVEDGDAADTHTYSLVAGTGDTDNGSFSIAGNALSIQEVPDYETQSSYDIRVRVQDVEGCFVEETYTISISNLNETPSALNLSNTSLNENTTAPVQIGVLSSVDDDNNETFTYTLVAGTGDTDNDDFTINGDKLISSVTFNYEAQSAYTVRVRTTDSQGAFLEQTFQIDVVNLNEAPYDLALSAQSINENVAANSLIGTFSVSDQDAGDVPTIILFAGEGDEDNDSFTLTNRELRLTDAPDYETKSSYNIRIKVEDNGGNTIEQAYTITINNLNETPSALNLSNASLNENTAAPVQIGVLSSVDDDNNETFTYTLVAGTGDTDNDDFTIDGDKLISSVTFNYEAQSTYNVRVRTTDSQGAFLEQTFQIDVVNLNEAPYDLALSSQNIDENVAANSLIGTFSVSDQDAGDVPTIILFAGEGDEDNGSFTLTNRELRLTDAPDYETKSSYNIRIKVEDNGGNTIEQAYTITINNLNETPTAINLTSTSLAEGKLAPIRIGVLSSVDDDNDETFSYQLVAGTGDTDNGSFEIRNDTLYTQVVFDYEVKNAYSLRVRTTDSKGAFFERTFQIDVIDINEPPYSMVMSNQNISENLPANSLIGVISVTDQDNPETLTFELLSEGENDNSHFTLTGTEITVNSTLNYEVKNEYVIHASVKDSGEETLQQAFSITVINQEETPTDIVISNTLVEENVEIPSVISTFSTVDDDLNETFVYTLVEGEGSDDNASFAINDSALYVMSTVDYETKSMYLIRVMTTDKSGLTYEEAFTIEVQDTNETPYNLELSETTLSENLPDLSVIGTLSVMDDDNGDVITFELDTMDADHEYFQIEGSSLLASSPFNFEEKSSYMITIIAKDQSDAYTSMAYTIEVIDENDTPFDLSLSNLMFVEDQMAGSEIGIISVQDEDAEDTHTFQLANSDDFALFEIRGNQLLSSQVFDYDLHPTATITIIATDQGGAADSAKYTITIQEISDLEFPSVDLVTPNNDGINDTWVIENVADFRNYSIFIYNAGGQLVYQIGSDYANDWNGNGHPAGSYYYVVRSNANRSKSFTGTLSLIK